MVRLSIGSGFRISTSFRQSCNKTRMFWVFALKEHYLSFQQVIEALGPTISLALWDPEFFTNLITRPRYASV
jgi:hypothetical protein